MFTFNVTGEVIPGINFQRLLKILHKIAQNVPDDWGINKSKKGLMCGSTYFEYLSNVFSPLFRKQNIKLAILLLVYGHKSHWTLQVAKLCSNNQILHFSLYPNAANILRPDTLGISKPLKVRWPETIYDCKIKHRNNVITKVVYRILITSLFREAAIQKVIIKFFWKSTVFPFNTGAVDYKRCISI